MALAIALALAGLIFGIASKTIEFGSSEGNWIFWYIKPLKSHPFLLFLALAPVLLLLAFGSFKTIQIQEKATLAFWMVAATILQNAIRLVSPFSLASIIVSDRSNSYYLPAIRYSALELLRSYESISKTFTMHAFSNMPGKILFFSCLRAITDSPQVMGYVILLISNLGGVLIYFITKKLFVNKTIALQALLLYLFIPSRIFFLPLLNAVSPVFILLALFLFVLFLERKSRLILFCLGLLLYFTFLFEPLPFFSGIIFIALLVHSFTQRQINIREAAWIPVFSILGFLTAYLLMYLAFGFNLFNTFLFLLRDAADFNLRTGRHYSIWVIQNLKGLFLNAGLAQSLLAGFALYTFANKMMMLDRLQRKSYLLQTGNLFLVSVLGMILLMDLLGIPRGETERLWIFAACYLPVISAWTIEKYFSISIFYMSLASMVLQTTVTLSVVGFVVP